MFKNKNDYRRHQNRQKPCSNPKNILINSSKTSHNSSDNSKKSTQNNVAFKCVKCCKTFTRKDNLDRHIMHFCKGKIQKGFCVEKLLKNFKTNNYDDLEVQKHNNVVILKGDKILSTKNSLIHIKRKKEYKCNYCDVNFSRSDSLNRHIDKFCKIKKSQDINKENIFQLLLEQNKKYWNWKILSKK